jgi:hypothetical protein
MSTPIKKYYESRSAGRASPLAATGAPQRAAAVSASRSYIEPRIDGRVPAPRSINFIAALPAARERGGRAQVGTRSVGGDNAASDATAGVAGGIALVVVSLGVDHDR